jgi:hypothetical protein
LNQKLGLIRIICGNGKTGTTVEYIRLSHKLFSALKMDKS